MPASPRTTLRLQLGSQFAPLVTVGSRFQASLCQALETELAERLDALGVPGTPAVQVVADETEPMSVRWFLHARECHYPDEVPLAAGSFVRDELLGSHVDQNAEQGWTAEQWTGYFRHFANAVLEQRPSALLGPEQTAAYAAQIVGSGLPEDSADVQAWVGPVLGKVLDLGLSIADVPRLLPILRDGRARGRAPSDLVEDLIAGLMPETMEIHGNLELIKRLSLGGPEGEKLIPRMRALLFNELGIRYPPLRFVVSEALPDSAFAFKIHAWPTMPRVGLAPDELLVDNTIEQLDALRIKGRRAINPANGSVCSVIRSTDGAAANAAGLATSNEAFYLVLSLIAELRGRGARFVSSRTVKRDLKSLEAAHPALVARVQEKLGLEQITRVLRNLAAEEVSIRNLSTILEHLLEFDYIRCDSARLIVFDDRMPTKRRPEESWLQDPGTLAEFVRTCLKRYITYKHTWDGSTMAVYRLDSEIDELLARHQAQGSELPEADRDRVLAAVARNVSSLPWSAQSPVLVTTIEVRSALRMLIQTRFPRLPVLCVQELSPNTSVQILAWIKL